MFHRYTSNIPTPVRFEPSKQVDTSKEYLAEREDENWDSKIVGMVRLDQYFHIYINCKITDFFKIQFNCIDGHMTF